MKTYRILLQKLSQAPPESWGHPFGYSHSYCTINGAGIVLHASGSIFVAGRMYTGWPTCRAGKKLFKQIRPHNMPYDQRSLERYRLEKIGVSEETQS